MKKGDTVLPHRLRTCGLSEPLGLDIPPEFSWEVTATGPDILLPSAEIEVVTAGDHPVWSSTRIATPGAPRLPYSGPELAPLTPYRWRVRVWNQHDDSSTWSDWAGFETGLLGGPLADARWIGIDVDSEAGAPGPVTYLRREFVIDGPIRRARSISTALGWYRLSLNGTDATGAGLFPGFTAFESRVQYQVRDITGLLREGANAVGVTVADGRFRGRIGALGTPAMYGDRTAAIVRLEVELEDGRTVVVGTDEQWSGGCGAIRTSDPRAGETIDARLFSAWDVPGAVLAEPHPVVVRDESRNLVGEAAEPLLRCAELAPASVATTPSGATLIDLGQNIHGIVRLRLRGPAGTLVSVDHSEVLAPEGEVDLGYLTGGLPLDPHLGPDTLILSGEVDEFVPAFCTQGFRYAALTMPEDVELLEAAGVPVTAALDYHGRFESADPRVNRFHENVVWSMRGNFLDVPTDCPTRERSGWTGDAQVFAHTATLLADVNAYLTNWLADARLQQHADGTITDVVPLDSPNWREGSTGVETGGFPMPPSGSAGWGDAIVLIPWELYQSTGSPAPLEQNYDAMVRWVERYARMASEHRSADRSGTPAPHERYLVDTGYHWGEWLEPAGEGDGTMDPMALMGDLTSHARAWVATAYFEHSSRVLAAVADLLGHSEDAARFRGYAEGALEAWRAEYVADGGLLIPDAQASYVRALEFDLVPRESRARIAERLVERVRMRDGHLATGFLSTGFLLGQLTENGHSDVALDLLLQDTPPSWLGQVERGATTVWETWTGYDDAGHAMLSHNHYSLGASARWLYEGLAGIRRAAPGWTRITIDPLLNDRVPSVSASTATPFGRVGSSWSVDSADARLHVVVPTGSVADVHLDGATEGAVQATGAGYRNVRADDSGLWLTVGSGEHEFAWTRAGHTA